MNGLNFTRSARAMLAASVQDAKRRHHEYVGTEHMLSAMLRDPSSEANAALRALGIDVLSIQTQLDATVRAGDTPNAAHLPELPFTSRAKQVLEHSMSEARELNHEGMSVLHLLAGLLREERGIAAQLLAAAGVTREALRERLRAAAPDVVDPATDVTIVHVAVHRADGSVIREEFRDTPSAIHFLSGQ